MSTAPAQPTARTLFLTDSDVENLSDIPDAIDAIRQAYRSTEDGPRVPGRIFAQSEDHWLRIMPAVPFNGEMFGSKSIVGSFENGLHVSYLISLFDKRTAELVALVDGNRVTGLRTAATSALGAQLITPQRALRVGVIGSGFEARSHLRSVASLLNVSSVAVYSPTEKNREAFAAELSESLNVHVRSAASAEDAAADADLVLCAARSRDETPIIETEWVGTDCAIVSIGSTTPTQRELPTGLIDAASAILVDGYDEVVNGSGDMIAARDDGVAFEQKTVTLGQVLTGEANIDDRSGIRIYKSTGAGLQDIAVAERLVQRAVETGIGTELPVGLVTVKK